MSVERSTRYGRIVSLIVTRDVTLLHRRVHFAGIFPRKREFARFRENHIRTIEQVDESA